MKSTKCDGAWMRVCKLDYEMIIRYSNGKTTTNPDDSRPTLLRRVEHLDQKCRGMWKGLTADG